MVRFLVLAFSSLTLAALSACSDMKSRPETADKLKPILVQVNAPTAADPAYQPPVWGDKVRLDFHFIAPTELGEITAKSEFPGGEEAAEELEEAVSSASIPAFGNLPIILPAPMPVLIGGPEVDKSYPGLQHIVVHSEVQLPTAEVLTKFIPETAARDFVRFRYQISVSDGTRNIPVTGDFPAYRAATVPGADWNVYSSAIVSPASGSETGLTVDVNAEVVNPQNEAIKIAWFTSQGEIKNRRASETEWKLPGAGAYTLVFTVRGKQSRTATLGFRTITAP